MDDLNRDELGILERISARKELQPFFFKKAKGLKWFDALDEKGYFQPINNPKPIPSKEDGYFTIPFWAATEYLVKTSTELLVEENYAFAKRFLDIIRTTTQLAMDEDFSNYRTWWQFSKIIQNIPLELIKLDDDFTYIDYWLKDDFERTLVATELGKKWLNSLLDKPSEQIEDIAINLLKVLCDTSLSVEKIADNAIHGPQFRITDWDAKEIINTIAEKSGRVLELKATQVFKEELERVLNITDDDEYSSLWRGAIEDHDQNHSTNQTKEILVSALRDSTMAYIQENKHEAVSTVAGLLNQSLQIVKRIAIYLVEKNHDLLKELTDNIISEELFDDNFRHEMWHFLHNCYPSFSSLTKRRVQEKIHQLTEIDDQGNSLDEATAYIKAVWFSAIKGHNKALNKQYSELVELAGAEPKNPDFSTYWTFDTVTHQSPKAPEELLAMSIDERITYINEFRAIDVSFDEPSINGLVKALKMAIKASPLEFTVHMDKYVDLETPYTHAFIETFRELWVENVKLPWDTIWKNLLEFCKVIIDKESFGLIENEKHSSIYATDNNRIIGSIGQLIQSGARSDSHSFSPDFIEDAKDIILHILDKVDSKNFEHNGDAVITATNSPRGICLEALIILVLHSCRLENREKNDHKNTWNEFQPIFEQELANSKDEKYEFITLLVYYLPNFFYMSRDWVIKNMALIFDKNIYPKWLCVMQAYSHVNYFYEDVYGHLKEKGYFLDALDDDNLNMQVLEKVIKDICIAYTRDHESLQDEGSLINQLLVRRKKKELGYLIWLIWANRDDTSNKLYQKVMELWLYLLNIINLDTRDGKILASKLCKWSVFVNEEDKDNLHLLLQVAAFAHEDHNSYILLESIARISTTQPEEAFKIWESMLQEDAPTYPEDTIRKILTNLLVSSQEGQCHADIIVDKYIRHGIESPAIWLKEIKTNGAT